MAAEIENPSLILNGTGEVTLRDYFAGQALQSLRPIPVDISLSEAAVGTMEWNAKWAYAYADAMLAERGKE